MDLVDWLPPVGAAVAVVVLLVAAAAVLIALKRAAPAWIGGLAILTGVFAAGSVALTTVVKATQTVLDQGGRPAPARAGDAPPERRPLGLRGRPEAAGQGQAGRTGHRRLHHPDLPGHAAGGERPRRLCVGPHRLLHRDDRHRPARAGPLLGRRGHAPGPSEVVSIDLVAEARRTTPRACGSPRSWRSPGRGCLLRPAPGPGGLRDPLHGLLSRPSPTSR